MTDKIDTETERVKRSAERLRDHEWFPTLRDMRLVADHLEALAAERDLRHDAMLDELKHRVIAERRVKYLTNAIRIAIANLDTDLTRRARVVLESSLKNDARKDK